MLRLFQEITIGEIKLPFVADVQVVDTRNAMTNTATLSMPNRLSARGKKISDVFKQGDKVVIKLGYFPTLSTVFEGYISQVMPDKTVTILCENEAYKYKRKSIGKDIIKKNAQIKALISEIYSGTLYASDANIGDWKISKNATLIEILQKIQSDFKIYCYFRGEDLIVGAENDPREVKNIKCDFQKNIPLGESSFTFKEAEAQKIIVKASNINRKGEIKEVFCYYSDGGVVYDTAQPELGAVTEMNITGDEIEDSFLKELAKRKLEALSFVGAEGSITVYGSTMATHGDIAEVKDTEIPEREGKYAIVEVVTTFGIQSGYRQELKLGIKI